jgi:hypothetical protein
MLDYQKTMLAIARWFKDINGGGIPLSLMTDIDKAAMVAAPAPGLSRCCGSWRKNEITG